MHRKLPVSQAEQILLESAIHYTVGDLILYNYSDVSRVSMIHQIFQWLWDKRLKNTKWKVRHLICRESAQSIRKYVYCKKFFPNDIDIEYKSRS